MNDKLRLWGFVIIIIIILIFFAVLLLIFGHNEDIRREAIGKDLCERIQLMDYVDFKLIDDEKIEVTCSSCSKEYSAETYTFKNCEDSKWIVKLK